MSQSSSIDVLRDIATACRKAFLYIALFSAIVNILMLTVPIYTLQLYDRVLMSQSYDTLIYLSIIVIFCIAVYAALELLRSRMLIEVGRWFDHRFGPILLTQSIDRILHGNRYGFEAQRDIGTVKNFLKSPSVFAFLDLPWFPIFLIAIFFISWVLGVITLIGAGILFFLAYLNQVLSHHDLTRASKIIAGNNTSVDMILHHAETVQAMGMQNAFIKKWFHNNEQLLNFQSDSGYRVGIVSALSKFFRIFIQVMILTVGAALVIHGELTGGGMIAASIITGRALAPVEQFISAWKEFFSAKEAVKRLRQFMNLPELRSQGITLPKAVGKIECDNVVYMPSGCAQPLLQQIHFTLLPGETLAILGPSGAGKSTLARLMLGVWPTTRGAVRLDGANVYTWNREDFGSQVGYLPQDTALMDGSIKENIACFQANFSDADVVAAAQLANAHDMILHLPKGYDTPVDAYQLSGGQAKRVALARAFYKNPCFVVLDEPETHLDPEGETALIEAIQKLKQQHQATLVIVTRHIKLIQLMDKTLVLRDGKMQAIGPTNDILNKMRQ